MEKEEYIEALCNEYVDIIHEYVNALRNNDVTKAADIRIHRLQPLASVLRITELYPR